MTAASTHTRRRTALAVATTAAIAFLLIGCSKSGDSGSGGGTGQDFVLKYGVSYSNPNWDVRSATNASYVALAYDRLVVSDPETGKLEPDLATSWKAEGDTITFTLRKGVTFHDGTTFDASAVQVNLQQLEGKDAGTWTGRFAAIKSIATPSDDTVVLTLANPPVGFLAQFGQLGTEMISPKAITDGSYKTTEAGTGPYVHDPKASQAGVREEFTKNAHYWNAAEENPSKIEMDYIADASARLNALQSGQVDVAEISAAQASQASGAGMTVTHGTSGLNMVNFLDLSGAFGDINVRQAFCSALDTQSMMKAQFGDYGTTYAQLSHEGWPGYDAAIKGYPYDPDAAKKYLAAAGNPKVDVTLPLYGEQNLLGQVVKSDLEAVGFHVTLVQLTNTQYFTTYLKGKYPVVYVSQSFAPLVATGPYADYLWKYAKDAPGNPFHTSTPQLDDLATKVAAQPDGSAEQNSTMQQMSHYINDQARECGYYGSAQVAAYNPKHVGSVDFAPWSPHLLVYGAITKS